MKTILIALAGILIISCAQTKKNNKAAKGLVKLTQQTDNFDWLLGKWKRLNEENRIALYKSMMGFLAKHLKE